MPTIASTLRSSAARVPSRSALVFGDQTYTYAELDAAVDRLAAALHERGLGKGDRLALLSTSSDRFVVAFYATHRLGAVFVPVNPASSAPELDYIVRDSGATFLLFATELSATVDRAAGAGLSDGLQVLALGPAGEHVDLWQLAQEPRDLPDFPTVEEHDDAQILYTSGTTGHPKGAVFDHHRVMWTAVATVSTCGIRDADRMLHVAPLYHAAELGIMLIPGTVVGATHVVHAGFDPARVLDDLERYRITMFFGVPTMYQFLLCLPDLPERDLSAWRTGLFGAAPMPASAVEKLIATLPDVNFMQLCGQTEAGPSGIFSDVEQVRERPDASGRQALVTTEARVVHPDGTDVVAGETGELILRGETIMKGYWNLPEATAETIVDGWLHTGDLCRVDPDGYLTLVDRLKDVIITGGRNVYSVEVEGAIAGTPGVLDLAVVGRPHEEYGESVVVVATVADGAEVTLEDIHRHAGEQIAHYKLPHQLVVVSAIPRNASGKILKRKLREGLGAAAPV